MFQAAFTTSIKLTFSVVWSHICWYAFHQCSCVLCACDIVTVLPQFVNVELLWSLRGNGWSVIPALLQRRLTKLSFEQSADVLLELWNTRLHLLVFSRVQYRNYCHTALVNAEGVSGTGARDNAEDWFLWIAGNPFRLMVILRGVLNVDQARRPIHMSIPNLNSWRWQCSCALCKAKSTPRRKSTPFPQHILYILPVFSSLQVQKTPWCFISPSRVLHKPSNKIAWWSLFLFCVPQCISVDQCRCHRNYQVDMAHHSTCVLL